LNVSFARKTQKKHYPLPSASADGHENLIIEILNFILMTIQFEFSSKNKNTLPWEIQKVS